MVPCGGGGNNDDSDDDDGGGLFFFLKDVENTMGVTMKSVAITPLPLGNVMMWF